MASLERRCGKAMRVYETAQSGPVTDPAKAAACGRPERHPGKCRSAEALARQYAKDIQREQVKPRRHRPTRRRHPEIAAPSRKLDTCGTYLAYLLHLAKGGTPCLRCSLTALRKQTAQAAQADRADFARAA